MTDDELRFFEPMPDLFPIYEQLRDTLARRYPVLETKVGRTQISLRNRYVFAAVSLPWRRVKGWPERYLLLSFGLEHKVESPRIAAASEPYPRRWTHHLLLLSPADLDREVYDWLDEAYRFAMVK